MGLGPLRSHQYPLVNPQAFPAAVDKGYGVWLHGSIAGNVSSS
jgi:hypothetical protein